MNDIDPQVTGSSTQSGIIWRLTTLGVYSFIIVTGVSILVFTISTRSIYDELEYIIGIIAGLLFIFLSYGLYSGARVRGKPAAPRFSALQSTFEALEKSEGLSFLELLGEVFVWIGISIVAILALAFLATVLWSAVLALGFMLYWLLYRAIRLVLLKGAKCKGNLGSSLQHAGMYTFLYCGWILGIVWLAEHRPW